MKKIEKKILAFIAILTLIILAEIVTSLFNPAYGLIFHGAILVSLIALSTVRNLAPNLFTSLSLAPLVRIISLSLPLVYFPQFVWYMLAGIPVTLAAIILMRVEKIKLKQVGLTFGKPLIQFGIAITGIFFGYVEYLILEPESLVADPSVGNLLLVSIILILSTGFVEEFVFRGVIQLRAIENLGENAGILGVTALFGVLHIGWLSIFDIIFVSIIGLFFGLVTHKTGSIWGASISHGITNTMLFVVMPLLSKIY